MSIRSIGIVGWTTARWIGRAAVRSASRLRIQALAKRTFAQKTTCPPLMRQNTSRGTVVVNTSHTKPPSSPPTRWPTSPVHLNHADPKRVEFWVEEARRYEPEPGSLCLSSYPEGDSVTSRDLDAILEAILKGQIDTLGLPKTVVASYVERLLNASALINWNILPSIKFFSRKNRESDEAEMYDLSRQTYELKELVKELDTRENFPFITIYNIPLTSENIAILPEFVAAKKTELVFYLTYNLEASFLNRANYKAMIAALKTRQHSAAANL